MTTERTAPREVPGGRYLLHGRWVNANGEPIDPEAAAPPVRDREAEAAARREDAVVLAQLRATPGPAGAADRWR